MATKRVLSFLQKGWTAFVDPGREQRLEEATSAMHKQLASQRESFELIAASESIGIQQDDQKEVARRVFKKCIVRAWNDEIVTEKEQKSLAWVAKKLAIPESESSRIQGEHAYQIFSVTLGSALADGVLDDAEYASLSRIAASCSCTPAEFFRTSFRQQGENFVGNLFRKVLEDGRLDQDEWSVVVSTIKRVGLTDAEFRQLVRAPAESFVEHILAEFNNDQEISQHEEACLSWMLTHLIANDEFREYVRAEVSRTKQLSAVRQGLLPSIVAPSGIALRAGEIAHFASPCRFTYQRRRGGEYVPEHVSGTAVVTDDRFVFASTEKSAQVIHSRILGYSRRRRGLEIQCSGSSAGQYEFAENGSYGVEIWLAAIAKSNQTLVAPCDKSDARRIPRDVRQRIWQRYGGKCAECDATHYLEFDHIIPVARGGGNSENNIQLLCRGCNSKKSDNI